MENRKNLEVFRASAGSGKTFILAVRYITLLIKQPTAYKHIVAVTFTNKATGEMKERILSQLYGIAYNLPSSRDYMEKMREAYPTFSYEKISEQARIALNLILHDYGHFRIQTIDSFFQSVLRSLAKHYRAAKRSKAGRGRVCGMYGSAQRYLAWQLYRSQAGIV